MKQISEESAEFADNSPEPDVSGLYEDVYAEPDVNGRLYLDMRER
jgi:TPP-dependent pyruvate/acetoin dehydrogenase alpha subunit